MRDGRHLIVWWRYRKKFDTTHRDQRDEEIRRVKDSPDEKAST